MSFIAIDYGKSKCGYAVGSIFIAESGTIKTTELLKKVQSFNTVVLGLPLSMSGNYSSQTFEVLRFALKLKELEKNVLLIDERLTTKMAKVYGKKDDDRFSAEQLLLDYIQAPQRAIQLKKCKIDNGQRTTECESKEDREDKEGKKKEKALINSDFALLIDIPYQDCFNIKFGIGFAHDPYIAYTIFSKGFPVYRILKDFVEHVKNTINEIGKFPDYMIMNKEKKQLIYDVVDQKENEEFKNLLKNGKIKFEEFSVKYLN